VVDSPKPDEWAEHPRWADAPRCTTCGQPLIHPESIELGVCLRHRPSTSKTLDEMDLD
jgi:hypothetical protein